MSHLTDEQLSALADGALEGRARAAAERHLEACAACRAALAGLVERDRDLRGALEHDPGDAYFEDFAARVGGRIRAAGLRGAQARPPEGRSLADWFRSPRKLAVVGALATVVIGAGIVMLSTREVGLPALPSRALERGAGQVAPMAETPTSPPPEPPVATGRARPTEAITAAPPAAAPEAARSLAARDEGLATPARDEERAVTVPATPPGVVAKPEYEARTAPVTANEARPAKGAAGEALVETKSATTRGGTRGEETGAALLQRTKQTLATAKEAETAADAFAGQPTFTTLHGRNAQRLTSLAEAMRRAPAWDSAAAEWATVLLGTKRGPLEAETRYQLARARYRAWQAGVTGKRAEGAREAFAGFLAMAPAGAQRDSVEAWQAAVGK